jgi:hypothetical protein
MHRVRARFWFEVVAGTLSALLMALTLVTPEWIEEIFGVEPDGGSGALEWAIVAALAFGAISSSLLARREWRRIRLAS